jgi:hypothetical protein
MMEALNTCETSVNFYESTRRNFPEDSYLHTHRREDLSEISHRGYGIHCTYVRFQVLTAASMVFRIVFWDVLRVK